ncbi:hypothetical protein QTP70_018089 [Hemibagrus guttatus]|uniref:Uncharacterized protein n=1 Tax=Hemibagrus guttatus TaxID=175788 RepID=A0AAE0PQF5_9TELE|nr:hypothetical protein QTP70_018089 [Hemibagrus guttatus]
MGQEQPVSCNVITGLEVFLLGGLKNFSKVSIIMTSVKTFLGKEEMSRENLQFTEIMTNSVKLQDGHNSLRLPFRNNDVLLPNNLSVAKQMCNGLRKSLERNERLYEEYTHFLSDVLGKGYAKKSARISIGSLR